MTYGLIDNYQAQFKPNDSKFKSVIVHSLEAMDGRHGSIEDILTQMPDAQFEQLN